MIALTTPTPADMAILEIILKTKKIFSEIRIKKHATELQSAAFLIPSLVVSGRGTTPPVFAVVEINHKETTLLFCWGRKSGEASASSWL